MRFTLSSFLLIAAPLIAQANAEEASTLMTTYTSTRTVYRVVTETMTGTPPAATYSATSTIYTTESSSSYSYAAPSTGFPYPSANTTTLISSSGAPFSPTAPVPEPTGAAAVHGISAMAIVAAGLGLLAL
ncbi:hypothetical protein M501DRAFT_986369 [Patellaria atrata CBS 101060]|uniref:Uncharacterized protein n=1 Tax=Patellaria atrata CBS 101060 TaxID=1346257 RepID=A0A9P4S809_9PEZI|nr:hypothetical protein M501DRAFT_986369 [Patellaria atrata CBS 101060]